MIEFLLVLLFMLPAGESVSGDCPIPDDSPQWPRSDPRSPVDFEWELFCECDPTHPWCSS